MGVVVRLAGRRVHALAPTGSDASSEPSGPIQSSADTAPSVNDLIASIAAQSGRTKRRRQRLTLTLLRPTASATASSDNPRSVMKSDKCMGDLVHPTHNIGQADCTSGVVYPGNPEVHRVYMPKAKTKPSPKVRRWRATRLRDWRKAAKLSLEEVCEKLAERPFLIEYTHASLGRVERGEQMPLIELIEALAVIYKSDVTSILNRQPGTPAPKEPDAGELLESFRAAAAEDHPRILTLVKAFKKTGS